jgi:Ni,Fe-hydrogenase III large subunit
MSEHTIAMTLDNAEPIGLDRVAIRTAESFRAGVLAAVADGARVATMFARDVAGGKEIVGVLVHDLHGRIGVARMRCDGRSFASLTPRCPQVHLFEREIFEQHGLQPEGHPWLRPVRYESEDGPIIGVSDFFAIRGEQAHEVAVGPVHAGVIEPGHFRFQCHGEQVLHLEISLGYQHRGVERALRGGPTPRTMHHIETLAGDSTIAHATAHARLIESLAGCHVSARSESIRAIALELERLANHTGDLGALSGDAAFLPTAAFCGRLRGDWLNATAAICGSRFGRGLIRPGGVGFDLDPARATTILRQIEAAYRDLSGAMALLWDSPSCMSRFEDTGTISRAVCDELGLVGPVARACGARRDVRQDLPFGRYRFAQIPVSTWHTGDVFARAYVRWLECGKSVAFLTEQLASLPPGTLRTRPGPLAGERLVVSLVEGWRGEVCHVAITDAAGRFASYKVVDPSFHNWAGLVMAMRDQQISDFPLCNKSFGLSYCGHDL